MTISSSPWFVYRYWGKARTSGDTAPAYHLLSYHCLDVAASGRILLESQPGLLQRFSDLSGIGPHALLDWSTFLLAIHDVGKFADGFQNLRPDLFKKLQGRNTQASYNMFPTGVGMNRWMATVSSDMGNVPHRCGDEPIERAKNEF